VSAAIRPRLVAVWLALLALVGAIAVIEYRDRPAPPTGEAGGAPDPERAHMLLPAPVEQLGAIEVGVAGTLHRFQRDASGAWFYHGVHAASDQSRHSHQTDPVAAQRIDHAFAGLGRARIERRLPLDVHAAEYGVTSPQMIVLVYRKDEPQPLAQFAVGDIAPDGLSRYVLIVGGSSVVTIANYQIDNLLGLIRDMSSQARQTAAGPAGK